MAQEFFRSGVAGIDRVNFDAGLRAFMQSIFNYMGGGLALTGLVAYITANTPLAQLIFGTPLQWVAMLAPLGFVMYMNVRMQSLSAGALKTLFWCFCATMGLSMASIFFVFTGTSIARAFFITAATFGTMSLWGYTTKKDLTNFGAFMMMGLIGIFLASVINIVMALFLHTASPMLQWVISVAGVVIFTGLTAWDVQRLKQTYSESAGEANDKLAIFGALSLYLNFINAFQFMLQLTGGRRN